MVVPQAFKDVWARKSVENPKQKVAEGAEPIKLPKSGKKPTTVGKRVTISIEG